MEKFVYVFSREARDKLLSKGYKLLKSDESNDTFVFENDASMVFSLSDISMIKSNTLTF